MWSKLAPYNKVKRILFLFLLATFVISFAGLKALERQERADISSALKIVLETTKEAHDTWLKNQKSILEHIAQNSDFIALVEALLIEPTTAEHLRQSITLKKLRQHFDNSRTAIDNIGFFIINKNRVSIGSMRDSNLGTTNLIEEQRPDLLERAFKGETLLVPPIHSDVPLGGHSKENSHSLFVITPVKVGESVVAVLTLRLVPEYDFARLSMAGRIGETGETYAFDRDGYLISNSRFHEDLVKIGRVTDEGGEILHLRLVVPGDEDNEESNSSLGKVGKSFTLMAQSALSGESGINVQGYKDYRGVSVFGAWEWVSDFGYGLTTEIDEAEALRSYRITKRIIVTVVTLMTFLSIMVSAMIFRFEEREKARLKSMNLELESRVTERTSELTLANNELTRTMSELKILQGIIPICSYCRHIRNDQGSWDMFEKYISEHTDAQFSHGICPGCVEIVRAELRELDGAPINESGKSE